MNEYSKDFPHEIIESVRQLMSDKLVSDATICIIAGITTGVLSKHFDIIAKKNDNNSN